MQRAIPTALSLLKFVERQGLVIAGLVVFASKRGYVVAGVCICAVLLSVVGCKVQWEEAKNSYGDSALKCIRPAIGCESNHASGASETN